MLHYEFLWGIALCRAKNKIDEYDIMNVTSTRKILGDFKSPNIKNLFLNFYLLSILRSSTESLPSRVLICSFNELI